MVYEASARMQDPVYGCVGKILFLQNEVSQLEIQLGAARAEILMLQMRQQQEASITFPMTTTQMDQDEQNLMILSNADSSNSFHVFQAADDHYPLWT